LWINRELSSLINKTLKSTRMNETFRIDLCRLFLGKNYLRAMRAILEECVSIRYLKTFFQIPSSTFMFPMLFTAREVNAFFVISYDEANAVNGVSFDRSWMSISEVKSKIKFSEFSNVIATIFFLYTKNYHAPLSNVHAETYAKECKIFVYISNRIFFYIWRCLDRVVLYPTRARLSFRRFVYSMTSRFVFLKR